MRVRTSNICVVAVVLLTAVTILLVMRGRGEAAALQPAAGPDLQVAAPGWAPAARGGVRQKVDEDSRQNEIYGQAAHEQRVQDALLENGRLADWARKPTRGGIDFGLKWAPFVPIGRVIGIGKASQGIYRAIGAVCKILSGGVVKSRSALGALASGTRRSLGSAGVHAWQGVERLLNFGKTAKGMTRPKGVPYSWVAKPSKKGGGTRFVDPANPHNSVRVMPGDPKSPFPHSQKPYVRHLKGGQSLDVNGNVVPKNTPEAHIPLDDFVWPF